MSTLTDPIADFLTRLRNAAGSHRADVKLPYSKIKEEIARILKEEGYIAEYEVDHSSQVGLAHWRAAAIHVKILGTLCHIVAAEQLR